MLTTVEVQKSTRLDFRTFLKNEERLELEIIDWSKKMEH